MKSNQKKRESSRTAALLKNLFFTVAVLLIFFVTACQKQPDQEADGRQELSQNTGTQQTETAHIPAESNFSEMEVHFLDVGQGDSTLIRCGESYMLIDAGDDTKGTAIQNYLTKQGVTKLDYLILTHPDSDHIGGAPVILEKFDIDHVLMSDFEKDNRHYRKVIQSLDNRNLQFEVPSLAEYFFVDTAKITILAPNKSYDDPNNASIALTITNGAITFLFTGDAEEEAEQDILSNGLSVKADVYKAGHHGSKTSTSEELLEAAEPSYAVISCAEGNAYGHPHAQTMNQLRAREIQVFRTDEQGSIIAQTDGESLHFNCAPSDTWQAGEPGGSSVQKKNTAAAQKEKNVESAEPAVPAAAEQPQQDPQELTFVLNVKTKKFHRAGCRSLPTTNRQDTSASREEVIANGYVPCKNCSP